MEKKKYNSMGRIYDSEEHVSHMQAQLRLDLNNSLSSTRDEITRLQSYSRRWLILQISSPARL